MYGIKRYFYFMNIYNGINDKFFVICFFILGYLGVLPPTPLRTAVAQVCSVLYFAFFLLMPIYSKLDKCKPEPDRVTG